MVAATYCPDIRNNPQLLVSVDQLRDYFRDAETELYRSKGFRQILADFKQRGALSSETQAMMKAVCREAIRSTLRQVCCIVPTSFNPESLSSTSTVEEHSRSTSFEELPQITPISHVPPFTVSSSAHDDTPVSISAEVELDDRAVVDAEEAIGKATPTELADNEATEASRSKLNPLQWWSRNPKAYVPTPEELRQTQLQEIGKTIQEARLAKAIPLEAIHQRTLIARHQIRAIEAGEGRWLPEDIYLKGFIRRMGDAVGLDGQALANQLTPLPSSPSARPSWHQHSPAIAATRMDPTRLYLGYAAVVAGSVWGLSWGAQHSANLPQVPVFQPETGAVPINPAPQTAQRGLTLQPTATVDSAGNVKIQFSSDPALLPKASNQSPKEAS